MHGATLILSFRHDYLAVHFFNVPTYLSLQFSFHPWLFY
jgi:hypothetical protein